MWFSNDGKVICCIGSDSKLLVIDAFEGNKKGYFDKVVNEGENPCFADFSIDSKYILTAGEDKILYFWNWKTNECVSLPTQHAKPIQAACFGKEWLLVASGC